MHKYVKEGHIYVDFMVGLVFIFIVHTVCFYAGIAYALACR